MSYLFNILYCCSQFLRKYQQGRTPNPDILCNKHINKQVCCLLPSYKDKAGSGRHSNWTLCQGPEDQFSYVHLLTWLCSSAALSYNTICSFFCDTRLKYILHTIILMLLCCLCQNSISAWMIIMTVKINFKRRQKIYRHDGHKNWTCVSCTCRSTLLHRWTKGEN